MKTALSSQLLMSNRQIIDFYYRNHQAELLTFVSSRLGGSEVAEDIVQDVFMRLLQCGNPILEVSLHALAYTIARNLVNDFYRRRQWNKAHFLRLADYTGEMATDGDEAMATLSVREVTEFLEHGLARVPNNCRELYRMHIYAGMKVSDISQQTGENYKSVEYRLGLARKEIRKYLRHIS